MSRTQISQRREKLVIIVSTKIVSSINGGQTTMAGVGKQFVCEPNLTKRGMLACYAWEKLNQLFVNKYIDSSIANI